MVELAEGCVSKGTCINLEIWEFPDLIEREEGADRLGVRDADKTKKKRKREAMQGDQFILRRPQQI